MKKILILGAGTAGTLVANKLSKNLSPSEWSIQIIDSDDSHIYQPGLLLLPFGVYTSDELVKSRRHFLPKSVTFIESGIEGVDPKASTVTLADRSTISYDYLIIATGTSPHPELTEGMLDEKVWRKSIFDFYTLEGAKALQRALENFTSGRLVIQVCEMPIKCPVAPLEFAFLADAYFEERKVRQNIEITYVTPLEGPFTKPVCSKHLNYMFVDREIALEPDFVIERIDPDSKSLVSMDEREIPFDLLVTVPVNTGADFLAGSDLVDEINYVKVDKETFLSKKYSNVFALGDASDAPASKAGSVAHFAIDIFIENFLQHISGKQMSCKFDGHANCFIEAGHGKGLLIDFNYLVEPLTGKFPLPVVGPFPLLKESRVNHWGKLAFRWIYWNLLIKGRYIPIPSKMSMIGKQQVKELI